MEAHLKSTYGFNDFRDYQKDIVCDLLNKENVNASNTVDLPAPFCPVIRIEGTLFNIIILGTLPVDKKFL